MNWYGGRGQVKPSEVWALNTARRLPSAKVKAFMSSNSLSQEVLSKKRLHPHRDPVQDHFLQSLVRI